MSETYCPQCGKTYSGHYCSCVREQADLENRREQERRNHELMIESMRQQSEDEREERMRKMLEEQQNTEREIAGQKNENQKTLEKEKDFKEFKKGFLGLLTEHIDISEDPAGEKIGQNENRARKLKAWQKKSSLWLDTNFFDAFDHTNEYSLKCEAHILKTKDLPVELVNLLKAGFLQYLTAKSDDADLLSTTIDEEEEDANYDQTEYREALDSIEDHIYLLYNCKYMKGAFDGLLSETSKKLNDIEEADERLAAEESATEIKAQKEAELAAENTRQQVAIQQLESEQLNKHAHNERVQSERVVITVSFLVISALLTWTLFSIFSLHSKLSNPGIGWDDATKQVVGYFDFIFVRPALANYSLIRLVGETGVTKYLLLNYSLGLVAALLAIAVEAWICFFCIKRAIILFKKASIPLTLAFILGPLLAWLFFTICH